MTKAVEVFISGIAGVFIGMALLYVSIKLSSLAIAKLSEGEEKK